MGRRLKVGVAVVVALLALPLLNALVTDAEEKIVNDPRRALDQYKSAVPEAQTHLIPGAGHSPNVKRPALTAKLVDRFSTGE